MPVLLLSLIAQIQSRVELNLTEISMTDIGLTHLSKLQLLTKLTLEQTQVTAAGIEAFKAARPECEVIWSPP